MSRAHRVAVIGAGIVGASVAYHLVRRGASVTLIDRGPPAGDCTGKSFAWIGPVEPDSPLGGQPIEDYRRLETELDPLLPVNWSGLLTWWDDPAATERFAIDRASLGHDVRLLERAEIQNLEPNLRQPPDLAAFASGAGAIDPVATTQLLIQAARDAGADIHINAGAARLMTTGARVTGVQAGDKLIEAHTVVVAAGAGARQLAESVGVGLPVEVSPALIVRMRTPQEIVNTVIATQHREFRQASPNIMLSPETDLTAGTKAAVETCLAQIRQMVRGAEDIKLESAEIGLRPMPEDGMPIIGFVPEVEGLYFTVMHSGVYFAPVMGRLAAVEILDGRQVGALDHWRPSRFRNKSQVTRG